FLDLLEVALDLWRDLWVFFLFDDLNAGGEVGGDLVKVGRAFQGFFLRGDRRGQGGVERVGGFLYGLREGLGHHALSEGVWGGSGLSWRGRRLGRGLR